MLESTAVCGRQVLCCLYSETIDKRLNFYSAGRLCKCTEWRALLTLTTTAGIKGRQRRACPDICNKELQHPTITIGFSTPRGHPHLRFVGGTGPGLRRWATCMAHNCSWLVFKDGFHPMRGRRVVGGCAARPCSLHWSVSPPPHDFGAALHSMNGSGRWRVAEAERI